MNLKDNKVVYWDKIVISKIKDHLKKVIKRIQTFAFQEVIGHIFTISFSWKMTNKTTTYTTLERK